MEPDLEIKVLEHNASVGAIPITWCIGEKTLAALEGRIKRCKAFIITVPLNPGKRETTKVEWRTVIPLKDMMTYVTLLRPGPSRIFVNIVDPRDLSSGDIDWWLSRKGSGFSTDLLTQVQQEHEGELKIQEYCHLHSQAVAKAHLDIDMPKECFAKPWSGWVMSWANAMYVAPAIDQCAMRKRVILAFTIQPILFLVVGSVVIAGLWLFRFLSALAYTLVLCRGVNWNPVIHPFKIENDTVDIWKDVKGSYLYFPKLPYSMSWGAAAVIPTATVATVIGYIFAIDLRYGIHLLLTTLCGLGVVAAVCLLFPLWVMFLDWVLCDVLKLTWLYDNRWLRWMDWKDDREAEREAWIKERERLDAELLLCRKFNLRTVQDLPSQKRTLTLRFKATKAQALQAVPSMRHITQRIRWELNSIRYSYNVRRPYNLFSDGKAAQLSWKRRPLFDLVTPTNNAVLIVSVDVPFLLERTPFYWNEPVGLIPVHPRPSKWAARWWPFRVKILEIRLWLKRLKRRKALGRTSY